MQSQSVRLLSSAQSCFLKSGKVSQRCVVDIYISLRFARGPWPVCEGTVLDSLFQQGKGPS